MSKTVATYGDLIKFCNGEKPTKIHLSQLLNILIVNMAMSCNTSKLVVDVARLQEQFPETINATFDSIGRLVNDAIHALISPNDDTFEQLETLFSINNNLLGDLHHGLVKTGENRWILNQR